MQEYKTGRGYVYHLHYHIVWCVKHRREVLVGGIEAELVDILRRIARSHGYEIVEANTDIDHVRLLVDASPQHYIPTMLKQLKGESARKVFMLHPELKATLPEGHLWNPSYFVATVSESTEAQVRSYIRNQGVK